MIAQDRSATAVEVERVLDDLLPLLQAVQPQKLATTLGALSQALQGRGEQLGQTLVRARARWSAGSTRAAASCTRTSRSSPTFRDTYADGRARTCSPRWPT